MCDFIKEAYEKKKWAFVSDFARLYILYNFGGIYLDTDVELLDNLDEWLESDGWFIFENENSVNTGKGCGAIKKNYIIKLMLDDYYDRNFIDSKGDIMIQACTDINTKVLIDKLPNLIINDKYQIIDNNLFITTGQYNLKAYHHGTRSWTNNPKTIIEPKKIYKDTKIKRVLRNYKVQYFIRNNFGENVMKVYTFLAYDLLETNMIMFLLSKIKKMIFCNDKS